MELIRYDSGKASPLPDGVNAYIVPIQHGGKMTAMLLVLDKKGDTGKRELSSDVLLCIVAGEGNLRAGNDFAEVKPGDVYILPGGTRHQIWTHNTQLQAVMLTLP